MNFLFVSGWEFETPIPLVTREGAKPFPPTGYASWMRAPRSSITSPASRRPWPCA